MNIYNLVFDIFLSSGSRFGSGFGFGVLGIPVGWVGYLFLNFFSAVGCMYL